MKCSKCGERFFDLDDTRDHVCELDRLRAENAALREERAKLLAAWDQTEPRFPTTAAQGLDAIDELARHALNGGDNG